MDLQKRLLQHCSVDAQMRLNGTLWMQPSSQERCSRGGHTTRGCCWTCGRSGEAPCLYCTVYISGALRLEQQLLQERGGAAAGMIQLEVRISGCVPPPGQAAAGNVAAVWKVCGDAAVMTDALPPPPLDLYTNVALQDEQSLASALQAISTDGASDMMPYYIGELNGRLQFEGKHTSLLTVRQAHLSDSVDPCIVLELHHLEEVPDAPAAKEAAPDPPPPSDPEATASGDSAEAKEAETRVEAESDEKPEESGVPASKESEGEETTKKAEDETKTDDEAAGSGEKMTSEEAGDALAEAKEELQNLEGPPIPSDTVLSANAKEAAAAVAKMQESHRGTLIGRVVVPLTMLGDVRRPQKGRVLPLEGLPMLHTRQPGGLVSLEFTLWGPGEYLAQLEEKLLAKATEEQKLQEAAQEAAQASEVAKGRAGGDGTDRSAVGGAGGIPAMPAVVSERLDVLCDDMMDKQSVVEHLLTFTDAANLAISRLQQQEEQALERSRVLEEDVAELRRLLHEERESLSQPPNTTDLEQLSHAELGERAKQLEAHYTKEHLRNQELVRRLQQMHEAVLNAREMKDRYLELQDAHAEQARHMQEVEKKANKREAECSQFDRYDSVFPAAAHARTINWRLESERKPHSTALRDNPRASRRAPLKPLSPLGAALADGSLRGSAAPSHRSSAAATPDNRGTPSRAGSESRDGGQSSRRSSAPSSRSSARSAATRSSAASSQQQSQRSSSAASSAPSRSRSPSRSPSRSGSDSER
ncbi:hypothetical protein CYMTET_27874 [Cymbomonas tetramitiformis]|uniref:Uncharacterized protein n=1 Tax=Cymbomonas tetramitiformis TaxID=36881 RepID=A0AAE0KWI1_9CHLO|nr:hypothetical protein CYMTET_27874 [Cymbomonas tetramitiformis]